MRRNLACSARVFQAVLRWLGCVIVVAIVVAACARETRVRGAGRTFSGAPVILISIDTLRSDHLPAYGYKGVDTPGLDAFRGDAVLFERAYSHVPMTLPSHISMLSGTLPGTHGVRNNVGHTFDPSKNFWLPCFLKSKGYATGAAVSTYVLRRESGMAACFDLYEDSIDPRAHDGGFEAQQRPGTETLDLAKSWIETHQGTPFFYFFHIYEPHVPYEAPEPYRSRYPNAYDGEVAASDAIVGDFLAWLREKGIYDRAVVIIVSDHGEGLGDHGEAQHSVLLNRELIQVPMILKLPESERKGTTEKSPVQLADLAPTLTELLGLGLPAKFDGAPLFGEPVAPDRPIFSETLYPRIFLGWSDLASVVQGRYHYIDSPRAELYDLDADFGETKNLLADERRTGAALKKSVESMRVPMQPLEAIDPEVEKNMAALGYLGSAAERSGPLPDPKEHIQDLETIRDALQLAHAGKPGVGAAMLREMLGRSPSMVEGWAKLGDLLASMGDTEGAANAYRKAVKASPRPPADLMLDAGSAALHAERLGEAENLARAAISSVPTRAHELLARVALKRGDAAGAEREARAAIGPTPRASAQLLVAETVLKQGRVRESVALLVEAERLGGGRAVLGLAALRADALMQTGDVDGAKAAFRREVEHFPSNLGAWSRLCVISHLEGDRRGVERLLEEMVQKNPGPRAALAAANTLETLGDRAGAARWNARARSLSGS